MRYFLFDIFDVFNVYRFCAAKCIAQEFITEILGNIFADELIHITKVIEKTYQFC